jgi:hypothetical protein
VCAFLAAARVLTNRLPHKSTPEDIANIREDCREHLRVSTLNEVEAGREKFT